VRAPDGTRSAFSGTIGATFEGLSFQAVLGGLEGLGAHGLPFPGVPFTGSFVVDDGASWLEDDDVDVAVTPEPGAALLAAAGLAGVGVIARRRRRA
jgi:MYXO-CTERM domain-containing protein